MQNFSALLFYTGALNKISAEHITTNPFNIKYLDDFFELIGISDLCFFTVRVVSSFKISDV